VKPNIILQGGIANKQNLKIGLSMGGSELTVEMFNANSVQTITDSGMVTVDSL